MAQRDRQPVERNLAMELVRVTEAASLSASVHMGKGDKELVDQAAVDAMRLIPPQTIRNRLEADWSISWRQLLASHSE